MEVFTIGHSTHALDEFLALLREHEIERLVDVRMFPGSRRFPHFERDSLKKALDTAGIDYVHAKALGGRRRPEPQSPNSGWRIAAFRGYADHMRSAEFKAGLAELERLVGERRTAVMCAEALWWHCHRRLIADALVARGWRVTHIASNGALATHEMTPFAAVDGSGVTYPGAARQLEF